MHTIASDQPKRGTVAYYKQKAQRGGSALMLAIAKQTAKDILKGAAYGAAAGAACGIPGFTYAPLAKFAYAYYSFDPSKFEAIKYYGRRPEYYSQKEWEKAIDSGEVSPIYFESEEQQIQRACVREKINLENSAILGGLVGAGMGALYSLYKQRRGRAFSLAWAQQVQDLQEKDFTKDPITIGQVPYLVSSVFSDIAHAVSGNHYEIYLMPYTKDLLPLFKIIVAALNHSDDTIKNNIACMLLRLDPRTTYYGRKVLPRIIIGLKSAISVDDASMVLQEIYKKTSSFIGSNIQPRYSYKITPLLYTAYGSGDYKEIPENQDQFARKGYRFWRTADDMSTNINQPNLALPEE
jgi:hypothetical protein